MVDQPVHEEVSSSAVHDDLWMIHAVIQSFRLDAVTRALEARPGFGGMTVIACCGFGHGKVALEQPRAVDGGPADEPAAEPPGVVDFTPKLLLAIAVAGRVTADGVVDVIARTAHTGRRGDGKIFMWPLARVVRVMTFGENANAL